MEDDVMLYDELEIPDELSYSITSQQVHNKIMKEWKSLKKYLPKDGDLGQKISEFDKLLNYFFE